MSFSGKSSDLNNQVLQQVFNATTPAWAANSYVYVALHTGNLTDASVQTTNEANFTGYARVAVARDNSHWVVNTSTNKVVNALDVVFPECSGGNNTITYVSVGTAFSGAGQILYWGALDSSVAVATGVTARFSAGNLEIQET